MYQHKLCVSERPRLAANQHTKAGCRPSSSICANRNGCFMNLGRAVLRPFSCGRRECFCRIGTPDLRRWTLLESSLRRRRLERRRSVCISRRLRAVGRPRLARIVLPWRAGQAPHSGVDTPALAVAVGGCMVGGDRTDPCAFPLEQDRTRPRPAAERRVPACRAEPVRRRPGRARRTPANMDRRYI